MPPRIRSGNAAVTGLETALAQTSISSAPCSSARAFSSTPQRSGTAQRRWKMHQWLKTRGGAIWNFESQLASPNPRLAGPQSDQPFPLNPMFKSEPVLSEELRNKIYEHIVAPSGKWKDRTPYLAVSREFGIDVRRVAAVVRLMEVEKQMIAKKKELATPYANLLATWLPQTPYNEHAPVHHEPINEITVHPSTQKQLFVPTSESRAFTRQDAAKAFHDRLLPADDRSFQRSLINIERQIADGRDPDEAYKQFEKAQRRNERHRESRRVRREAKERKSIKVVQSGRSEVRIKDYSSSNVGNDGRKVGGVGWRYGVPHMDRKRGTIKIPTEVPSQRTAPQQ